MKPNKIETIEDALYRVMVENDLLVKENKALWKFVPKDREAICDRQIERIRKRHEQKHKEA